MPFYEYQCAACGAHHEELQRISDRPLRKCPACGKSMLRRLVSAPVFRLKGGGWYETDFKADKEGQRNIAGDKEPAAETTAAGKPQDAKAETKPAKADESSARTAEAKEAKESKESKESKPAAAKPRSRAARARATRRSPARRGPRR